MIPTLLSSCTRGVPTSAFISVPHLFNPKPTPHFCTLKMESRPVHHNLYGPTPTILLTNDDGIHPESALVLPLAKRLVEHGHDVVVCAPGKNNSACGHGITLADHLTIRRHRDYEKRFAPLADTDNQDAQLHVFSIDEGTPADCVIAAIEPRTGLLARLKRWPRLTMSGINYGQNLGSDIIYSGTFAAARQAAMYGIPAVASSVDLFKVDPNNPSHIKACECALNATTDLAQAALTSLPEDPVDVGRLCPVKALSINEESMHADARLMHAFARGDLVLNVNIPLEWKGEFQTTRIDSVLYRNVISVPCVPTGLKGNEDETITVKMKGSSTDYMHARLSDTAAVCVNKVASITPVSTWPISHPLALPNSLFEDAVREGLSWLPSTSKVRI